MEKVTENKRPRRTLAVVAVLAILGVHLLGLTAPFSGVSYTLSSGVDSGCKIAPYVRPKGYEANNGTLHKIVHDAGFRKRSAAKLSGAVQRQTDASDDAPSLEADPNYWRARFGPFHDFLAETFPGIWSFCDVEKVHEWGLVLTWKGLEELLRPVVLTAHQDVVPVSGATLDQWTHPPYEGVFDGDQLWGRGLADCKNLLIGLLEAAEELHASGFRPRRTVVFAFGFDEEIGGERGAAHIGRFLLDRYGKNGAYAVIDEGGQSLISEGGIALALVGTSEKGLLNVNVGLHTPGGHSSVPPEHTGIGLMAEVVTRLERTPFEPLFTPRNPTFYEYQCVAEHSHDMPRDVARAIRSAASSPAASRVAAKYIYNSGLGSRALVTTLQAVDVIFGGVKLNALPEYVEAVVNHRVAVESTVQLVVDRDVAIVRSVAEQFGLGLEVDNAEVRPKTDKGYFSVSKWWALEPAPFTPVFDAHWDLFAGTLRHVYEEVCQGTMLEFEGKTVVPTPGMAAGNTDTQYYWDLTEHIYRYRPGLVPSVQAHAHGTDEHIPFDSHLQIIAFYYQYLQVIDAAED